MSAYSENSITRTFLCSYFFKPVRAFVDDMGNMAKSLNVVNSCRVSPKSISGRKRRFFSWLSFFSFHRFHEACFFSANISSRASMDIDVATKTRIKNLFSEVFFFIRLINCLLQYFSLRSVFATNIYIASLNSHGISCNKKTFYQLMRFVLNDLSVFKGPRL